MGISIKWFSHAIRLVKPGLQFVFKIIDIQDIVCYTLSDESGAINLTRFLYQIYLLCKSHENDCFCVQNTEAH